MGNIPPDDDRSASIVAETTPQQVENTVESGECSSSQWAMKQPNDTAPPSDDDNDDDDEKIFIGYDTEWCPHPKRKRANRVLSYALHLLYADKSASLYREPSGPDRIHRLTMARLIGLTLQLAILQGVIRGWPKIVYLVTHFGRGDLAACPDFKLLRPNMQAVRGTLITPSRPISMAVEAEDIDEKTGLPLDRLPLVPRARPMKVLDRTGNQHIVKVRFLDTYLLAPAGASLDALGKLLNIPKLELPAGYDAADMARFHDERPNDFRAYNLTDARIAATYARRYAAMCKDEFGLGRPPSTLGGLATKMLLAELKGAKIDRIAAFGMKKERSKRYSRVSGRQITHVEVVPRYARRLIDAMATPAYHGGRTETFMTGPVTAVSAAALLRDIDLKSAYPTAMSAIGMPDLNKPRLTFDPADFKADVLGFAEIDFEVPPHIPYPPFAVPSERGLLFVRRGTTVATAPEIAAAVSLGVKVVITLGIVFPWDLSIRPYESFVIRMSKARTARRDASGKETLESATIKTVVNSVYGKIAQAVRPRSVFEARSGGSRPLGPSAVTNAACAAYITGLIRGAIAEMLNSLPEAEQTVSVSTDGFLTTAAPESISLAGPACQVLLAARRRIEAATGGGTSSPDHAALLEVKKRALEVVAFRNRGIATTAPDGASDPILAKASVKAPRGVDANCYMLELYSDRSYETRVERKDLISLRAQIETGADLVSILRSPHLNLEPDFKRDLVDAHDATIKYGEFAGRQHLATRSVPFDTVDQALARRALFDEWRHGRKAVLKRMADWLDWEDFRVSVAAKKRAGGKIRVPKEGAAGVLKRQFLRAAVRGLWGCSMGERTHQEFADWLTETGYKTSVTEVKNASRVAVVPASGVVGAAPGSLALLLVLVAEFPSLEVERFFQPDDLAAVKNAVGR